LKDQFIRVCVGNLVLFILGVVVIAISGGLNSGEAILSIGVLLLLLCLVNILVGTVVLIASIGDKKLVKYGSSMLLFAAIALLCSFTCCSIQPLNL